jgi:aerobic-type carbon monoxide dehydrogenase small subunit (CoxS/CutS family)
MRLTVNGVERDLSLPPLQTLLHALREELGITSPKAGCQEGGCGACTVLVDGEPRRACLVPLAAVDGASVTTAEGLGEPGRLSTVQAAFHEQYGLQCGFCSPGFVVATTALLERSASPSRDEILENLGGHVCRCTGYVKIVAAVEAAARGDVSEDALHAGATGRSRGEPEVLIAGSPA